MCTVRSENETAKDVPTLRKRQQTKNTMYRMRDRSVGRYNVSSLNITQPLFHFHRIHRHFQNQHCPFPLVSRETQAQKLVAYHGSKRGRPTHCCNRTQEQEHPAEPVITCGSTGYNIQNLNRTSHRYCMLPRYSRVYMKKQYGKAGTLFKTTSAATLIRANILELVLSGGKFEDTFVAQFPKEYTRTNRRTVGNQNLQSQSNSDVGCSLFRTHSLKKKKERCCPDFSRGDATQVHPTSSVSISSTTHARTIGKAKRTRTETHGRRTETIIPFESTRSGRTNTCIQTNNITPDLTGNKTPPL